MTHLRKPNLHFFIAVFAVLWTANPLQAESQTSCYATEVVSYNQGQTNQNEAVLPERSDPTSALGAPNAQGSQSSTIGNFFSLGYGGELVLKFGHAIANGSGPDIKIWETSWGDPSCSSYPEYAEISVSQDGNTWYLADTVCLDGLVEIPEFLDWVQYVKIVDVSNPNDFNPSPISDGYDVDAIECLNGEFIFPEPEPGCFASEVISYDQGLTNQGNPVRAERSNPNAALGSPQAQDPTNWNEEDFFSLGFGGHMILSFGFPIANGPGADLRIYETTGLVSGNPPTCSTYPEFAEISVSQDGVTWFLADTICLDGEVEIPEFLDWIMYVKITDVSDPNAFSPSPTSDGFDVDAVECLHGEFIFPEPEPEPGCFASEVVSYDQGLTNQGNPVKAERSNPNAALGAPQAQDPANYNEEDFFSLGFGGHIVLSFGFQVANGPGADLRIYETTGLIGGNPPTCSTYPEFAEVSVSQDGVTWFIADTICLDGDVEIPAFLDWISYVKIRDISDPNAFSPSPVSDGFDVDAVECLNGQFIPPPDTPLGCFATNVVSYNQAQKGDGSDVDADRSDPQSVLGASDAQSNSSADLGKFFSLGFGGEIVVSFDGYVLNGPGPDLKIWETTWNFVCGNYPEEAEISASIDGVNWTVLDTICHTGEVDLDPLPFAKYIRIVDVSDVSAFSQNPGELDGFDVDAIECLNGLSEFAPKIAALEDVDICEGNTVPEISFTVNGVGPVINNLSIMVESDNQDVVSDKHLILSGDQEIFDLKITSLSGVGSAQITITAKLDNGPEVSTSFYVHVNESPSADAGEDKSVYAYAYSKNACADLEAIVSGGSGNYSFEWSNGKTTSSVKVCPSETTTYYVTVTDDNGCDTEASVMVNYQDLSCGFFGKGAVVCLPIGSWFSLNLCVAGKLVPLYQKLGATIGYCSSNHRLPSPSEADKYIKNLPGEPVILDDMVAAYPNPFSSTLNIEYIVPKVGESHLTIMDVSGKIVYDKRFRHTRESLLNQLELDFAELAAGTYFIRVTTDESVYTYKVQKSH